MSETTENPVDVTATTTKGDDEDAICMSIPWRVGVDITHDNGVYAFDIGTGDGPEWKERRLVDLEKLNVMLSLAATDLANEARRSEALAWVEHHTEAFVVLGHTGRGLPSHPHGESRQVWPARVFLNHAKALAFVEAINAWCNDLGIAWSGDGEVSPVIDPDGKAVKCPLDPAFRVDRRGVYYTMETCRADATSANAEA